MCLRVSDDDLRPSKVNALYNHHNTSQRTGISAAEIAESLARQAF
ncbi:hypothetical protein BURCENBC7_AP4800 [Burkholderia cenocepacia BC7]|nr:hypothetical protein BURCENBC7_AP4800 [Burkholderia cenocepacia BC7]